MAGFEPGRRAPVAVETVASEQRFPSLAAAIQQRRDTLPEMQPFLAGMSDAERAAVWDEIEQFMRRFERADGVVVPHERLLGVGTK